MIYSVKEYLEDGVYTPIDVKMKQVKRSKSECVMVQKKFSKVRDKTSALKAEDWDWIVVVFILLRFSIRLWGFSCYSKMVVWSQSKDCEPVECEDHLDSLSAVICLSKCLPSLLGFNLLTLILNCISRTLHLPLRL